MRTIPLLLIASLALLFPALAQAQADRPRDAGTSSGWKPLFDGRSLDGWEHVGPGKFVIENGVLRTEGGMGLLCERTRLPSARHDTTNPWTTPDERVWPCPRPVSAPPRTAMCWPGP